MALREFKLPDPGEGLTEAEIVTWHVAPGDTVKVNDVVVEVETAKSLVELPVPFAGTVGELLVAEGDTVEVGTVIITVDDGAEASPAPSGGSSQEEPRPPTGNLPLPSRGFRGDPENPGSEAVPAPKEGAMAGRTAVLVGYGVKQTEAKRRPRKGVQSTDLLAADGDRPSSVRKPEEHHEPGSDGRAASVPESTNRSPSADVGERTRALAKPPVRKLAKDLGVDLQAVTPTGEGGIVTRADVEAAAASGDDRADPQVVEPDGGTDVGWADGDKETRIPVKGVRKLTAQAMVASAFTAPHVTEWVTVDVTATMDLVDRLKRDREFRDAKVTPLLVLARALCVAIRRNPGVNSSWDEAAQEIVLKHDVNLGIATATPRGLVVPNVKDAGRLSMRELADEMASLTATAREGRTPPADMAGGTITITNVGVFGVDAGTPILNPGEAAILAFGSVTRRPWVVGSGEDERIEPRWVTTLALSFDHRLVDGELGSRFLADVAALMSDPSRALVWG